MATYSIDYNDKRFQEVKNQEATAIKQTNSTYNEMINSSNKFYQEQIDASKDYANKQTEIQNQQTDFAIEKVNQAKDQAKKDYVKEQKGAYTDYQKATNEYGANAEALASQGLNQTGYSESTRTSAYNTYQNRYMSARESYNQAILNYDNSIKEAQLANSAALAQIAYEALQKQLELSLQGFQYKNQLILQKLEAVNKEKDRYYQRYQNVLQQINTENALAEQVRQYNETLAFQKQQAAQQQANWEKEYALAKYSTYSSGSSGGSSSGSASLKKGSSSSSKKESKKETSGSANLSNTSSSSKKQTKEPSKNVAISYNGQTYYQSYQAALSAGGYGGYSLTGALQKGYLTTIKRDGQIYYAPVGKSSKNMNKQIPSYRSSFTIVNSFK